MADRPDEDRDPIIEGVAVAARHLGRAGIEVLSAAGAIVEAIGRKVRPGGSDPDDEGPRQRIPVD